MTAQKIIEEVASSLQDLPGIVGIVLGGSRARGTHRPSSDIDIGIYYDEAAGFDVNEIGRIATKLDDEHRQNIITPLGGWGPWVNGGGWLVVHGYHVDFIFRDVNRVAQVIDECTAGSVTTNYHSGHPHAYLNVMYMGELSICRILHDPAKRLAALQAKTRPYPKALQEALIGYFMFEASFSLMFADKNVENDDITYVAGCCYRTIACLNQVLFARNEEYCINEKKAAAMIDRFPVKPNDYKVRIDQVITLLSVETASTRRAVHLLRELVAETEALLAD
ncbi:nucleotidyltransferase domain-containing protein [Brevibacillus borstelensis]|uniref:nucleotidyltransferase domain-containing protein n=1 Tax=Brevibacillus borstelensis TaxID=45462 RepID=UPI0030BE7F3D